MGTKGAWTPERRARQAERIRQTKPWEKSTGPRTIEGKAAGLVLAIARDEGDRVPFVQQGGRLFDAGQRQSQVVSNPGQVEL